MAIFNKEPNINNLITVNGSGITIATYADIRDTLIQLNKSIYGNDIDVSSASSDGQYINSIALIINNILQLVKHSYNMLDPATATSKYLDILCGFSNITRKQQTKSTAQLYVKYVGSNSEITPDYLYFVDRAGNSWTWTNIKTLGGNAITFKKDAETAISDVTCDTPGSITASGANADTLSEITWGDLEGNGDIYLCAESDYQVIQLNDAIPGRNKESDYELRTRKSQSLGSQSVSILSGLEAAILNIAGVKDVWIYNNDSSSAKSMTDGTEVLSHNIYVVIRAEEGITLDSNVVGKLIYNKLTPGVLTKNNTTSTAGGEIQSYEVNTYHKIYWKQSKPLANRSITITCIVYDNYDAPDDASKAHEAKTTTETSIANAIISYLNGIYLGEEMSLINLNYAIQSADILKNGSSTYKVSKSEIDGDFANLLSHFYCKSSNIAFSINGTTMTINVTGV